MASGLIFSACSDDKNANPPLTEGDPNDPNYIQAQLAAEAFVAIMTEQTSNGFGYLSWDGSPMPPKTAYDSSSAIYYESTGWWVIYWHSDDTTGSDLTYMDSVRFRGPEGQYQMFPDSLTTEDLEYRRDFSLDIVTDTSSLLTDISDNLQINDIQTDQVVLHGNTGADIVSDYPQIDLTLNYDAALTSVTFNRYDLENEPEPHPVSGSVALALHVLSVTPQGSGSGDWAITVTFFVDHYHARFESGGNYWEWDGQYGG
jgi:hypothetical protein